MHAFNVLSFPTSYFNNIHHIKSVLYIHPSLCVMWPSFQGPRILQHSFALHCNTLLFSSLFHTLAINYIEK